MNKNLYPVSNNEEAYKAFRLGVICMEDDLPREAIEHFTLAAKLDRKTYSSWSEIYSVQCHIARAKIMSDHGPAASGLKYIDEALKICNKQPEVYYCQGMIHVRQGETDKAQKSFEQAIVYSEYHANSHFQLASLYSEQGDDEKAEEAFELAVNCDENLYDYVPTKYRSNIMFWC